MKDTTQMDIATLVTGVLARQRRALGKAISCIETGGSGARELIGALYPHTGKAHLIGVTGSPGAGKSSLVQALLTHLRLAGIPVAVLAVDPSSPFTGGALLGDRVRMGGHGLDPNVFIRSMGSRGHQGGISLATSLAARVLDAAGYAAVIIETAGVGQTELDIAQTADTTVLVLNPETGDEVQASKAGIMEVADLFVINKGDLPGARAAHAFVRAILELDARKAWDPPIMLAQTQPQPAGIGELWAAIADHRTHLETSGILAERRARQVRHEVLARLEADVRHFLTQGLADRALWGDLLDAVVSRREVDPLAAADAMQRRLPWDRLAGH
jgi:LAO/AO transport system kinase